MAIAQKECNETLYWLELMTGTGYISEKEDESMKNDAEELLKLVTAGIKTVKQKLIANH